MSQSGHDSLNETKITTEYLKTKKLQTINIIPSHINFNNYSSICINLTKTYDKSTDLQKI